MQTEFKSSSSKVIPSTPLGFLWFTLKQFRWLALVGFLISIVTQVIAAGLPLYFGYFVDAVQESASNDMFAWWAAAFVLINGVFFAGFRLSGFLAITLVLKQHVFAYQSLKAYLVEHSHTYFSNRFAGAVANKVYHAADRSAELLLMLYYGFVRLTVAIIVTGILIALVSPFLVLLYVVVVVSSLGINVYLAKLRRPFVVAYAEQSSTHRGAVTDVVTNMATVRQYANQRRELDDLNVKLTAMTEADRVQWKKAEWNHLINNILTMVLMTGVVGGAWYLLVNGESTIGEMVVVMLAMYRLTGVMVDIGDWMNRIIKVYGEIEEGLQTVLVPYDIVDVPDAHELVVSEGEISWDTVSFTYEAQPVFTDFNLTIKAGERIGLVGASGAGKSTFVSLLLRQHELTAGAISIDGQDIATVTQDSLRRQIAIVPQEPALFHRSIRENIRYGNLAADDAAVEEAARLARVDEFVNDLPEGYETLVGERGVKLSGGQKQRVAIARAILKDAPILILDEATSALDSESEVAIQAALQELMKGKTVIAVAHRLSTLREMDCIVVLEKGQIIEHGSHQELAQAGGTYQRLWEHQAGGFITE